MQVYFKPEEVTYERLLDEFFAKVDPTTMNRQGNDMGTQYRSVSCLAVAADLSPSGARFATSALRFFHVCPCVLLTSTKFAAVRRQAVIALSMQPAAYVASQGPLYPCLVAQPAGPIAILPAPAAAVHLLPQQQTERGSREGEQHEVFKGVSRAAHAECHMPCVCWVQAAAKVNEELSKSIFRRVLGTKVVTTIEPAQDYYLAEDYHQQ